jgi:hypothetical protein
MMTKLSSPLPPPPSLCTHICPSTVTTLPTSVPAPQNTPHHIPSLPTPTAALAVAVHDDDAILIDREPRRGPRQRRRHGTSMPTLMSILTSTAVVALPLPWLPCPHPTCLHQYPSPINLYFHFVLLLFLIIIQLEQSTERNL